MIEIEDKSFFSFSERRVFFSEGRGVETLEREDGVFGVKGDREASGFPLG